MTWVTRRDPFLSSRCSIRPWVRSIWKEICLTPLVRLLRAGAVGELGRLGIGGEVEHFELKIEIGEVVGDGVAEHEGVFAGCGLCKSSGLRHGALRGVGFEQRGEGAAVGAGYGGLREVGQGDELGGWRLRQWVRWGVHPECDPVAGDAVLGF